MSKVTRREFAKKAAITGAGFVIVPRAVLGGRGYQAPSDVLNIATVGIGGMGGNNTQAVMSQNIVALCDVDDVLMERRLTGWRDPAHKEPCVGSSYYDTDTGLWVACHCPKCYNLDWWARTIEPSRLLADCAAEIADKTKKAKLWKSFGGQEMDRNKSEESMKMAV